ncbi:histone-lysine N-methyltransferase SETMAR [Trichonephila clavipes]|nr:histone-lysine N-methyltransferase SETMAR [Trichonephila clavipes]
MVTYYGTEKAKYCLWFHENRSAGQVRRNFVQEYKKKAPKIRPCASGTTLKRNGKTWNGVLLHHLVGKFSEQKNDASERFSLPFLIVKALSTRDIYQRGMLQDLNPLDFFLFPRLKFALKRKRFDDIPGVQRNVTRLLNSVPKEDSLQSFQDMHRRSQGCIFMGGDNFDGQ